MAVPRTCLVNPRVGHVLKGGPIGLLSRGRSGKEEIENTVH